MLNTQEPMKRSKSSDIIVHSIFHTIQGEGPFAGHPALFVRLVGCNLQCPLCDTEYTEQQVTFSSLELFEEIYDRVGTSTLIVITGGEPFRQPVGLTTLCKYLLGNGYRVQMETNGTMAIPNDFPSSVNIVCSPKATKLHPSFAERVNQGANNIHFKYVVKAGVVNMLDGLPLTALDHPATPYIARPPAGYKNVIYVQPADEKNEFKNAANLHQAIDSCMTHNYVLQLQLHKYINME